jgi:hypothetical protein
MNEQTIQMHIWKKSCTISCLNAWLLTEKLHKSGHYSHVFGTYIYHTVPKLGRKTVFCWKVTGLLYEAVLIFKHKSTGNQHKVDNRIPTPKIQSIRFTKCHYRHYLKWTTITQVTEIGKSKYFAFIKSRSKTQFWYLWKGNEQNYFLTSLV